MAASGGKTEHAQLVFWTKPKSSEKDSVVPGVNDVGNMRPRFRGGRTKEIKAVMPVVQPQVKDLNSQSTKTQSLASSSVSHDFVDTDVSGQIATANGQGVSLRDLCVEDKKRVANLIRELARLGEEKEHAEKNLEEERKRYEEQILSLVEQQEQLLKEYEVQKTLVEYQTYILKLQQQQKRHQQKQQEKCQQQQVDLPVQPNQYIQKPLQKVSNTSNTRYRENVGHWHRIQGPLTYISEAREDLHNDRRDEWQRKLYMNDAAEDRVDNCSTEANPSMSLPAELKHAEFDLQRPFTAIIDKELAYQRQLLAATVDSGNQGLLTVRTVSAAEIIEKAHSPRPNTDMFHQKIVRSGHQDEDLLHRHADQQHQADLVSLPQNHLANAGTRHPECSDLGQEYPHLPAEKSEIIARFMQSQVKVLDSGSTQHGTQNRTNNAASVTHQYLLHPAGDCGSKVVEGDCELSRKRLCSAPKVKKKKPPPASYGPLHAPVMSSTQKSSEFGDSLSMNSSVHADHRKLAVRQQQLVRVVDEDVDNVEHDNNYVQDKHMAVGSSPNKHGQMLHKDMKKKEKHDHGGGKHSMADVSGQFVDKYKQMSTIERKTQLLKQRSLLLEEQVRLKKILAEQQYQMQTHRHAADLASTQQTALEKDEKAFIEISLVKLEEEVARKEQELLHERERLEKKRQEYAHKEPGTPQAASRDTVASTSQLPAGRGSDPEHRACMSVCGTRTQLESPAHVSDSNGHTHKQQQTRTSHGREARHSKVADVQAEKALLPVEEKHIPGNVRDACVSYPSPKVKDIVKKLDYSLNSDTESDTALNLESVQHSTPASRGAAISTRSTQSVPAASSIASTGVPTSPATPQRKDAATPQRIDAATPQRIDAATQQRIDASTSVSFAHMASITTESPSGHFQLSTGTEMTPIKSTEYTRTGPGSKLSRQAVEAGRQQLSLGRSDRTYMKGHGSILPEDEVLSDVEIFQLLSEPMPVSRSQQGHTSRSLSKVTSQHDVSLKKVPHTQSSQQPSARHQQNSPVLIDKFSRNHLVESDDALCWNPQPKCKPRLETDPVLELFEVKRPLRNNTSRRQHLKNVLGLEDVSRSGCKSAGVCRQLHVSGAKDDAGSDDDDDEDHVIDEVSVEKVIQILNFSDREEVKQILNFSNREEVKTAQRSGDINDAADVCAETVADDNTEYNTDDNTDDNTDGSDETENRILEEVFFVRS